MDRIVDFLMDNVSNLSSARNITNTLGSVHEKTHHTTVRLSVARRYTFRYQIILVMRRLLKEKFRHCYRLRMLIQRWLLRERDMMNISMKE